MDLAQSILQELITLQKKNEELARIIGKLEHESDIIIQQFEHKIEELQLGLKREQDDKSRASRRYEAEIRDLEGSQDALIEEIAKVRDTYASRVTELEEQIQSLSVSLEKKENEYIELKVSSERENAGLRVTVDEIQARFTERETSFTRSIDSLNQQVHELTDKIRYEQDLFHNTLLHKDEEISSGKDTLRTITLRLYEIEEREKSASEHFRGTIDHLNHTIHSERQIRTRELTERDEQVREYEDALKAAEQKTTQVKKEAEAEIARLHQVNTDTLHVITRFGDENKKLTSDIAHLSRKYQQQIQTLNETFSMEKDSLQQTITSLTGSLQSSEDTLRKEIRSREDELAVAVSELARLKELHDHDREELGKKTDELTLQISGLYKERNYLSDEYEKAESEVISLKIALKDTQTRYESQHLNQNETIEDLRRQLEDRATIYQQEMNTVRDSLQEVMAERDQIAESGRERNEFFRGEISELHEEISMVEERLKAREDELVREIVLRDSQISDLSTNNEALRAEIERTRLQYIRLQETIRAEKDESVHALYREISSLEDQVAGKNTEISGLTKKVLRLDAENTRLLQNPLSAGLDVSESTPSPEDKIPETAKKSPDSDIDPRRREIFSLTADLGDPARAPEAAKRLTEMGSRVVDMLIPLLHTGSIQRRVWIAVVLYEINDNRATLPLMKLLETPKVHFRELIWEAKNQYRSHSRTTEGPAEAAGIRAASPWPGYNSGI